MIVSWLYRSPATRAAQIGFVTVSICSIVGFANSGAVTRMNSVLGRRHPHQPLLEPLCLQDAPERLIDDEHDPMAPLLQHVGDRDAIVRRAPRPGLGEERDRLAIGHRSLLVSNGGNLSFPSEGCPLRPSGRCAWFSRV
jgi:hypothetical protein